ncbi:MAG: 23S rRNA (adenine(2030)-N(6))-methyltransferase RlmJ [Rhodospirillales bacterium]
MNYRHAFHAGNFADVFKHAILALALQCLAIKNKPLMVLDTHAGAGGYDLAGPSASRTGEWQQGIARILGTPNPPDALWRYVEIVRGFDRKVGGSRGDFRFYPGSPRIVRALLRPDDRLVVCELHHHDAVALKREFAGDRYVDVRNTDGYAAIKALLPPTERRGLVLIDPPFEDTKEFVKLQRALKHAQQRFATGVLMAWYPIKNREAVTGLHEWLAGSGLHRVLTAEIDMGAARDGLGDGGALTRCGIVLANAPWPIEQDLDGVLPWLAQTLGQGKGKAEWRWLVKD